MYEHLDLIDRFAKRGLWMCLIWPMLASPVPRFPPPAVPPELARVGDLEIEEFDIDGVTLDEINQSVEDRLIRDPDISEIGAAAYTSSWLDWKWDRGSDSAGGCRATNARVITRFRIHLPRLVSSGYSNEVGARWKRYRRAIEQHEARHVLITLDYARRIERALAASSCADAEAVVAKLRVEMNRSQDAFDDIQCSALESGRRTEAAIDECVFPWLDPRWPAPSVAVHRPSA